MLFHLIVFFDEEMLLNWYCQLLPLFMFIVYVFCWKFWHSPHHFASVFGPRIPLEIIFPTVGGIGVRVSFFPFRLYVFAPEPFIEKNHSFSTALLLEFCHNIGSCIGEGQFGGYLSYLLALFVCVEIIHIFWNLILFRCYCNEDI